VDRCAASSQVAPSPEGIAQVSIAGCPSATWSRACRPLNAERTPTTLPRSLPALRRTLGPRTSPRSRAPTRPRPPTVPLEPDLSQPPAGSPAAALPGTDDPPTVPPWPSRPKTAHFAEAGGCARGAGRRLLEGGNRPGVRREDGRGCRRPCDPAAPPGGVARLASVERRPRPTKFSRGQQKASRLGPWNDPSPSVMSSTTWRYRTTLRTPPTSRPGPERILAGSWRRWCRTICSARPAQPHYPVPRSRGRAGVIGECERSRALAPSIPSSSAAPAAPTVRGGRQHGRVGRANRASAGGDPGAPTAATTVAFGHPFLET
jgi:hypothetical protein